MSKVVYKLEYLLNKIIKLIRLFLVPLMALIFLLLFIQVLFRYVFNLSVWGIEESVLYLVTYGAFIGAAVGFYNDNHPRVKFIFNKLSDKYQFILEILFNIVLLIFCYFLITKGYELAITSSNLKSTALNISMFWPYFAIPLGGVFMFLIIGLNTIISLIKRENYAFQSKIIEMGDK